MVPASRNFLYLLILMACCVFVPSSYSQQPSDSLGTFPPVKSQTLEKRPVQLPQDFEGQRNLLFIAFQREQQSDIDTWSAEMKRCENLDPGFRYYEIPTIDRMNPFVRWFINTGMRRGIPDKKARDRTITLYLDKPPFEKSLQIPDERSIYILVVDRSGRVLWRTTGLYEEAKGERLEQYLSSARATQPVARVNEPEQHAPRCCARNELDERIATTANGGNAATNSSRPVYVPLTGGERWHRYWKDTVLAPGLYFASAGAALGDQASNSPREWGGGWGGYGRRAGSNYGLFLSQETIYQSGAAALHTDPRYFRCQCQGAWKRTWHTVEWSFFTYNDKGHKVFDVAQLAGAYGSGMISRTWYPAHYSPLVQGVQTGHMQMGFVAVIHLFEEFSPELKRMFPHRQTALAD